jgi:phospholipid/cholesterol/gamma-HCH transport system substrate-binding protein
MSTRITRGLRVMAVAVVAAIGLSACDADVYSLPLPGGADVGDDPITVEVEFEDVLDLVPQSSVKVNDISVGRVTDVELTGQTATVSLELRNDTQLPANSVATIRQTSLLGEKFVSLAAPTSEEPVGSLADETEIPLERTGANPDVEEVLGALSLLLNGGGIAQLRTIAQEINLALDGREESARSLLRQVDAFMGQLDANKGDIVDAIESLNRLSIGVREQQDSIDLALEELPSSLASLDRQRGDLVDMLQALDRLSNVGVRVINRSKDVTVESLRQLQPVLTQLANSGDSLVDSFNVILTYPFVDEVVGRDPQVARNLHVGDYINLSARLDLDLTDLPELPGLPCTELDAIPDDLPLDAILDLPNLCVDVQDALAECVNDPSVRNCSGLPGALIDVVCANVNLPLPVLCPSGGGGGGGGGGGLPLPDLPDLPLPTLPDLLDDLGGGGLGGLLNRPATSDDVDTPTATTQLADGAATYGELMRMFDPGLTRMLTPGMVLR